MGITRPPSYYSHPATAGIIASDGPYSHLNVAYGRLYILLIFRSFIVDPSSIFDKPHEIRASCIPASPSPEQSAHATNGSGPSPSSSTPLNKSHPPSGPISGVRELYTVIKFIRKNG